MRKGKETAMLTPPTMDQLQQLKLAAMAAAWTAQQQDASCSQLGFDERFALLVQAEWVARENARLTRTLQAAKLKLGQACVEGIDYPARRELDKAVVRQLASGRWIAEHQQILISGMTGTGKTYVACTGTAPGTGGCRASSRRVRSRGPTGPTAGSSASWPGWMCWPWTILRWCPSRMRNGAICSRSWRTGTARAPPSSRASSSRSSGIRRSGIRPWRMRSAIGCCTTAIGSCSKDRRAERRTARPLVRLPNVAPLRSGERRSAVG